ncbi:MAG: hypothetical protein PHT69_12745 [Bacteroidales bacterium]|nr:hypothetical protein [Bacteroidales bacterium]
MNDQELFLKIVRYINTIDKVTHDNFITSLNVLDHSDCCLKASELAKHFGPPANKSENPSGYVAHICKIVKKETYLSEVINIVKKSSPNNYCKTSKTRDFLNFYNNL